MLRVSYLFDGALMHSQSIFRRFSVAAILWSTCASAGVAHAVPTGIVHTADVDLAYYTEGHDITRPPVIAVNGGPGLTHAYMEQNDLWERLSEHRRIVFYDQRGNGRSTRVAPNAPQTLEAQVADLEALRMSLRADIIDLVGDSFGGLIVLAYTLAHPSHVRHLIVSDGLPGWKAIVHPLRDVFPDLEAQEDIDSKRTPESQKAQDRAFRVHIHECFGGIIPRQLLPHSGFEIHLRPFGGHGHCPFIFGDLLLIKPVRDRNRLGRIIGIHYQKYRGPSITVTGKRHYFVKGSSANTHGGQRDAADKCDSFCGIRDVRRTGRMIR